MLILTRKPNEIIKIGDDITISILDVRGRQVRIGIQAPQDVPVHREEVHQRIQAEAKAETAKEISEEANNISEQAIELAKKAKKVFQEQQSKKSKT